MLDGRSVEPGADAREHDFALIALVAEHAHLDELVRAQVV
jgi:hypothetical protein